MAYKWFQNQEEEELYRQSLLRKARQGDEHAARELQETFGVRVW